MNDPMKEHVRQLDAAIVGRGGASIFAPRPVGRITKARDGALAAWAFDGGPVYSSGGLLVAQPNHVKPLPYTGWSA